MKWASSRAVIVAAISILILLAGVAAGAQARFPDVDFEITEMNLSGYQRWDSDLVVAKRLIKDYYAQYAEKYRAAYESLSAENQGRLRVDDIVADMRKFVDSTNAWEVLFPFGKLTDGPRPIRQALDLRVIETDALPKSATVGRFYPFIDISIATFNGNQYAGYSTNLEISKRRMNDFLERVAQEYARRYEDNRGLPAGTFFYGEAIAKLKAQIKDLDTLQKAEEFAKSIAYGVKQALDDHAKRIDLAGYPHLVSWFDQEFERLMALKPGEAAQEPSEAQRLLETSVRELETRKNQSQEPAGQTEDIKFEASISVLRDGVMRIQLLLVLTGVLTALAVVWSLGLASRGRRG